MSIAISITLQPSRTLQTLQYGMVVLLLLSAIGIFLMLDVAMPLRYGFTAICVLAAGFCCWWQQRQQRQYRLKISPDGVIALACLPNAGVAKDAEFEMVQLLAGSTIWPNFMLLRLLNDAGKIYSLALMADSSSADNFRALAVAVRCIIRRKSKIA